MKRIIGLTILISILTISIISAVIITSIEMGWLAGMISIVVIALVLISVYLIKSDK